MLCPLKETNSPLEIDIFITFPTYSQGLNLPPPQEGKMIETKKVRFSDNTPIAAFHKVPSLDQITPEEKRTFWFSSCDYEQIKFENDIIVRSMTLGAVSDDMCTRGLEDRLRKSSDPRKLIGLDVVCAVLDEQDRQRNSSAAAKSILDPERLRSASMHFSHVSQMDALEQGYQDAIAAGNNKSHPVVVAVPENDQEKTLRNSKNLAPKINRKVTTTPLPISTEPKRIMSVAARRLQRFMDRTKSNKRGV